MGWFALAAVLALAPVAGHAAPAAKAAGKKKPKPKPAAPPTAPEAAPAAPAATVPPAADAPVADPAPPQPAVAAPAAAPAPAPAAPASREEEVVDFDAEEKKLDQRLAPAMPPTNAAGGPPGRPPSGSGDTGYKLIVDLLLKHTVGTQTLSFTPNHTLVILMVNISERANLQLNIAPDPAFYELTFAITSSLLFKVGKLLIPFGTNNYHHILGGRVDEQSQFLPETWGDFGLGVNHLLVDTKYVSVEYDAYVVNGFGGTTAPIVSAGTITDNNFGKGLGGRVVVGLPRGIRLIGSVYHSLWNLENSRSALYYAAGASIPVGAINLPVLDRLGLRGEWSRGELQYPDDNVQQGITSFAVAKAAFYGELTARLFDIVALRIRFGQLNPDNTVPDEDDVQMLEPAIIVGSPKLAFIAAWQFTKNARRKYSPTSPSDVVYAKVFLQY